MTATLSPKKAGSLSKEEQIANAKRIELEQNRRRNWHSLLTAKPDKFEPVQPAKCPIPNCEQDCKVCLENYSNHKVLEVGLLHYHFIWPTVSYAVWSR